eukprot:jgi/Astpho2/409/fgenesh1_pm.00011_%23_7_t
MPEAAFLVHHTALQCRLPAFKSVVKVFCIHTEPNYSLPWQRKRQYSSTSSGFMVTGENGERYLLTNAHSVEYWSQVRVRRRGHDQKFLAQVLAVGVECDIALLTVEDPAFWEDVQPLKFGPLPRLQDAVAVVGYPVGGDTLSVSTGVISRIEVTSYAHGSTELLAVQIDAAINSGNSGGPVFNDLGLCVGIAFQSYAGSDAENIGYIIPTPVIQHFLLDFRRNNTFTGFPAMGLRYQRMESATLRAAYQMGSEVKGVLVRELSPTAPVAQVLKADDVITHFDGVQVSSDGTVPFRAGERISFGFLTSQKFTGNHATVRVLRDGQPRELDIELVVPRPLVPIHLNNQEPSYLVVSGIVFTPCCEPYLVEEYGEEWMSHAPPQLLKLLHKFQEHVDEQVVVLSQVLADETTLGYEDQCNLRLLKFNQQPVRNLRHLADMVYHCKEAYMRFDLDHAQVVILETSEVKAATARVLEAHSVPFQCSKDLREEFQDLMTPA